MACDGEPPPAKCPVRGNPTGTTTIYSLPADMLREIFLHLPSLATLVRAACTCRDWWRAVAFSPAFRRSFCDLHPAPLLGLFFGPPHPDAPAVPVFAPVRHDDPDLAAAIFGGDFFLTYLQVRPRVQPSWFVVDSRGGYLLLMNWEEAVLALLNPLARRFVGFFDLTLNGVHILEDLRGDNPQILHARLICDDEDPRRFDICCLVHEESRVRAAIFSSCLGGHGFILPWLEVPAHPNPEVHRLLWLEEGMHVGRFIYWPYKNRQYVVIFDTNNRRLSVGQMSPSLNLGGVQSYIIGKTKSGRTCVAYANGYNIGVMLCGEDGRDAGTWATSKVFNLNDDVRDMLRGLPENYGELELAAIRDDFVYFTTSRMYHRSDISCWFASLCLETGKVERLFRRTYDGSFQPYHMAWTSFLIHDGDPEDAAGST